MTVEINPEMVRLARDARGLTQEELSEASEVAQGTISKLELALKQVGDDTLQRIAGSLHYPTSLFYLQEQYRGMGISVIYYRKRASTLRKHTRRLQAQINLCRIQAKAILSSVELRTRYDIQYTDISEFPGTPDDIAAMTRAGWNMPRGPIPNLTSAIENAGGIVFRFPFGTKDIDAISQWPDDTPPLFFINAQAPADRTRFSLAHELGHMLMHQGASETMEHEANRFAASLLMPEEDIRSQLHSMSLERAGKLKPYWGASMKSIIFRAHTLECMTDYKYTSLLKQYSKRGYQQSEPFPIEREEPKLISRLIAEHMNNGFTHNELATAMHLYPDEFQSQYTNQAVLRLA